MAYFYTRALLLFMTSVFATVSAFGHDMPPNPGLQADEALDHLA